MKQLIIGLLGVVVLVGVLLVSNYNSIQTQDEAVTASASEMLNQYKRRADLIPNLVKTVQASSDFERQVLQDVVNAPAKVGQMNISVSDLSDPALLAKFQQAQTELGSSLSRLLAVSERYPDLKSNALYSDLMVQLEGSENRIAVARGRYIESVREYNTTIRKFPAVIIANYMGYTGKPNFSVENEAEVTTVPDVQFQK